MPRIYPKAASVHCLRTALSTLIAFAGSAAAVMAQPVIRSFSPLSGPVGTTVNITGSNFGSTAASNTVYFGNVPARVTSASATTLTVTAPTGATYQPITVTTNNLTAYSSQPFVVTFPGRSYSFGAASFTGAATTAVGSTPYYGAIGDIDGDGKPDFVVPGLEGETISILRNTGTPGTVSFARTDVAASNYPRAVALGDIDGDGKIDMVVTSNTSNHLLIYLNTSTPGTVSFAAPVTLTFSNNYAANVVAVRDIDGDGKPDIVAITATVDLSIFLNTGTVGNVSFAPGVIYTVPNGGEPSLSIGDMDGDGKPDIVVCNSAYYPSVFRNLSTPGTVSLGPRLDFPAGSAPFWVTVGDLDGDGLMDMAVVNANDNTVSVFRNTTSGGTISFAPLANFATGTTPVGLCMADLNGDGKPELITANDGNNTVSVLQNTSTSGAISFASAVNYGVGNYPYAALAADMDGDGVTDILTVNEYASNTTVLRNLFLAPHIATFTPTHTRRGQTVTISGTNFTGTTALSFGGVPAASFTVVNDTTIEAVVGAGATGSVALTTSYGTSSLAGFVYTQVPLITSFLPTSGGPGTVLTLKGSNFTGTDAVIIGGSAANSYTVQSDTVLSATVGATAAGDVALIVTNASGSDTATGFYAGPYILSFSPLSGPVGTTVQIRGNNFSTIAANDVVYFGAVTATVLSATPTSLTVTVPPGATYWPITVSCGNLTAYSAQPFTTTFSTGVAAFTDSSFSNTLTLGTDTYPYRLAVGDIDGDGKPDIVVPTMEANAFYVFRNTSVDTTIAFGGLKGFATPVNPVSTSLGDLDGDGKLDVVVTNSSGGGSSVSVFLNNSTPGSIAFLNRSDLTTGLDGYSSPTSSAIADLDGDGKPDLVVANASSLVTVYRNNCTPGYVDFYGRQNYPVGVNATSIMIRDLDGDGRPDIVTANSGSNTLSVLMNTSTVGSISFAPAQNLLAQNGPYSLAIGDVDGDGKPDIAVCNANYVQDSTGQAYYSVSVLRNTCTPGTLSFAAAVNYKAGNTPVSLAMADMDGDGKPDLVATTSSDSVSVFKNTCSNGTISFLPFKNYAVGVGPFSVAAADLDGDGRPDLVVANTSANTLTILRNKINKTVAPVIRSFTPDSAAKGDTVTIIGNYLTGTIGVSFGGTPATAFTVVSDTLIKAILGAGSSGKVVVSAPNGSDSLAGFTFIQDTTRTTPPPATGPGFQLISFTDTVKGQQPTLRWQSSDDQSVDVYVVERGTDSLAFSLIGNISSNRDSGVSSYAYTDAVLPNGLFYYRLKMVDTAGNITFSPVIAVMIGDTGIVPPPVQPEFQLLSFTDTVIGQHVQLMWVSANDEPIAYYVIQSATDTASFHAISGVTGGKDSAISRYSFTDPTPESGVVYYRLKMEDTAGNTSYSPVLTVNLGGTPSALTVYPNPVNSYVYVVVPNSTTQSRFSLFDMSGQVVKTVGVGPGTYSIGINVATLNPGVYLLIWSNGFSTAYQAILVMR
jgi:hypothetical protein